MAQKKIIKSLIYIIVAGAIIGSIIIYQLYSSIKTPNINLHGKEYTYIYIPTDANFSMVKDSLYSKNIVIDKKSFEWVAEKKGYTNRVKPGKYKITDKMSNNSLINLLRSGRQTPIKLVFNKVRTKERFAGIIAKQIEPDSVSILTKLNDALFLKKYNKNRETALTIFIPNTYEMYWNTDTEGFFDRMYKENKRFWNKKRLKKAEEAKLSPDEVYILASIVEEETNKNDEKPKIAGVYINRLRRGIRLQACPTAKFATGDFEAKRVLTKHIEFDSPYNTYKYAGLPPGPICIPTISSIDAVLNYSHHNYLYFCAKDDFSGYNVFSKTLKEHNRNATKYQKALNQRRIYR